MKKYVAIILSGVLMTGLCACGGGADTSTEPASEVTAQAEVSTETAEADTEAAVETATEAEKTEEATQALPSRALDEDGYEIEGNFDNTALREEYADIISEWEKEHGNDAEVGYGLIYLDEDDNPELILFGDDDAWFGMDMYTAVDGKAAKMEIAENDKDTDYEESPYLSPGWEGKGDYFFEREGIYIQQSGMMGSIHTVGYKKDGNVFNKIFDYRYIDMSYDEENNIPSSYSLSYKDKDGKDVNVNYDIKDGDDYYEIDSIPEAKDIEKVYGIKFIDMTFMDEDRLTYDDITSILP